MGYEALAVSIVYFSDTMFWASCVAGGGMLCIAGAIVISTLIKAIADRKKK